MSTKRNGLEQWCGGCGKYRPSAGFTKSANDHKHICEECARVENKPTKEKQHGNGL